MLPTQQDIAKAAKVNASTVSRALNNDPRLPPETRQRILEIAASLGYRPDPLLSALSNYRRKDGKGRLRPSIVYLRRATAPKHPYHADLLKGAQELGARYGYSIEYYPYEKPTDSSLERILRARGVRGLLIEPILPEDAHLKIDLTRFAVVVVDNPHFSRDYDRVTFDNFRGGQEACEQCLLRGYKRPGLMLSQLADRNGELKAKGGYLTKLLEHGVSPLVEPLILPEWTETAFKRWLKAQKVDAVITSQAFIHQAKECLAEMKLRVPQQVGLLNNNVQTVPAIASGIHHNNFDIGAFATELLISKLTHNEYGPNPHARVIAQQGRWIDAGTLRPLAPPAAG